MKPTKWVRLWVKPDGDMSVHEPGRAIPEGADGFLVEVLAQPPYRKEAERIYKLSQRVADLDNDPIGAGVILDAKRKVRGVNNG